MKKFILLESRITDVAKKWNISVKNVNKLATLDPTPTKKYLERIASWIDKYVEDGLDDFAITSNDFAITSIFEGGFISSFLEDLIKGTLTTWEANKNNPALLDRDIYSNRYDDLMETSELLDDLVYGFKNPKGFIQIGLKKFPQSKLVFSDDKIAVVHLADMDSAIYYSAIQRQYASGPDFGGDYKWCIGRKDETNNMFDKLHEEQEFFFVQNLNKLDDMFMINFTFFTDRKNDITDCVVWDNENSYDEEGVDLDAFFNSKGLMEGIFTYFYKTKQLNVVSALLQFGYDVPEGLKNKITKQEKEEITEHGFNYALIE